jgi:Tfp pilus assembly protein PilX
MKLSRLFPVACSLSPVPCYVSPLRAHPARQPRGAALVMAMVALLVVTLMAAALVQALVAGHRQARRYGDQLQAQWLAEAGLARAAAKLQGDPTYQGEIWQAPITKNASDAADAGQVTITVEAATKKLIVEAVYPTDEIHQVLVRREIGASSP